MKRNRPVARALLLAMLWLGLGSSSVASNVEFKIIVHPDNPIASVDRDFLRGAFLRKATTWRDGKPIQPVGLAEGTRARTRFIEDVLQKSEAQLRSYWVQRIFSGTGVPPPEADSPSAAIQYVLTYPGGIGYLPIDAPAGRAKVLELE